MGPCQNPNCNSYGAEHPNCMCYGMAEGGEVAHYCSHGMPHEEGCKYYADGGSVSPDFIPDNEFKKDEESKPGVVKSALKQTKSPITNPDFIPDEAFKSDDQLRTEQYGTLGQQAITGLEGAGRGLVGPIAPIIERAIGVEPEDIRAREEENPIASGLGEVTGLIAPAIATVGASTLARAGATTAAKAITTLAKYTEAGALAGIAEKIGLKAAPTLASKMGVAAAQTALDSALISGSDEVSKMILQDPNQSAESAIAHIGLNGVLGGILGGGFAVPGHLWEKAVGDKAGKILQDFKARLTEHTSDVPAADAMANELSNIYGEAVKIGRVGKEVDFELPQPEGPIQQHPDILKLEVRAKEKLDQAAKDFEPHLKKFESLFIREGEDNIQKVDPELVDSYLDGLKSSSGPKQKILENFLEAKNEYRKSVNEAYKSLGQPEPLEPMSTNLSSMSVGDKTIGAKLADQLVDKVLSKTSGAAIGAAIGHATGIPHGGVLGAILGQEALGKLLDSVLPSIAKPVLESAVNSAGFKSMVDFATAVAKNESMLNKASKNVFRIGSDVLTVNDKPNDKERNKLNDSLKLIQEDPQVMNDKINGITHYLPNHAESITQSTANAVSYLNNVRASQDRKFPLDSKPVLSTTQKTEYKEALDIAQQPLIILEKIKDGTLTQRDIQTLGAIYPNYYNRMKTKLGEEMVQHVSKGEVIPYKTRIGLSMFMAQPLDSTMSPEGLMATQMAGMQSQQRRQQQQPSAKGTKSSPALQKMPGMFKTPSQSRQSHQQDK